MDVKMRKVIHLHMKIRELEKEKKNLLERALTKDPNNRAVGSEICAFQSAINLVIELRDGLLDELVEELQRTEALPVGEL